MNVHLTAELEELIQKKVQSGRYNSASEVMREALRLMEQRDELLDLRKQEIRRKIEEGFESLQRGQSRDGEDFMREMLEDLDLNEATRKAGEGIHPVSCRTRGSCRNSQLLPEKGWAPCRTVRAQ